MNKTKTKKFLIKEVKINPCCCFVKLEDNRWMGLGDLIYETFEETAKLEIQKMKLKIVIEGIKDE